MDTAAIAMPETVVAASPAEPPNQNEEAQQVSEMNNNNNDSNNDNNTVATVASAEPPSAEPPVAEPPAEPLAEPTAKHPLDDTQLPDSAKKQKTDQTTSEEAAATPATPMTPAPKPPAEPDMNNLPANPLPAHQKKYALNSIKAIRRLKDASPFVHPVDTVKLNIPFYYNYITHPMDLSTMEKKLAANAYATTDDIAKDFALIVSNCEKFNGKDTPISQMARNIHASFEKHMLNMPPRELKDTTNTTTTNVRNTTSGKSMTKNSITNSNSNGIPRIRRDNTTDLISGRPKREIHPPKPKDLPYDIRPRKKKYQAELRFCQQVLKDLMSKKFESISWPFLEPVDPVAMDCPNYFDVVKNPMDLGTIQSKLSNGNYENANEFENDIRLVFSNCFLFNPPNNSVHNMGKRLEAIFNEKWASRPRTPVSTVNSDYESDDDDEFADLDDDDFNVDINSITDPTIEFLLANIQRMTQDLKKMRQEKYDAMKKDWLKKRNSKRGNNNKRKSGKNRNKLKDEMININNNNNNSNNNSSSNNNADIDNDSFYPRHVSYEMKKEISEAMQNINDKQLKNVITIIKEGVPGLQDDDEIELEMDSLDNSTLLRLYRYLIGNKRKKKNGTMKDKNGKKEDVEEQRIAALKEKLAQFEKPVGNESSSDDDDDDDDESDISSEEE